MNIPSSKHWAIITTTSITIPGDERSRTNPGHGYPEHTEEYINYDSYTDKNKWLDRITLLTKRKEIFTAIEARPAKIETNVTVKIT